MILSDIKVQVCIFAFDILYLNGQPLLQEQLKVRREVRIYDFLLSLNKLALANFGISDIWISFWIFNICKIALEHFGACRVAPCMCPCSFVLTSISIYLIVCVGVDLVTNILSSTFHLCSLVHYLVLSLFMWLL